MTLEDNKLSNSIPQSMGTLNKLKYLNLARNLFTGSIPNTIGNNSNLIVLNLSYNQLSGGIPNTISFLSKLNILDISHNLLSGVLPPGISQLASIRELYLNHNFLSGNLPASLANLTTLFHIWLNDNLFIGAVPDLRSIPLNSLHIENNSFDKIPDYSTVVTWGNQFPFGLVIYGNKFTFEDLIPLNKIHSRYYYSFAPQDPITLDSILFVPLGTNYIIMTGVDPGLTENNFKWFKDTAIVYISNSNIYELLAVSENDEGYYSGEITNLNIPNFKLTIAKFRVVVYDPRKCDTPVASNNCKAAPEFCSTLDVNGYCGTLSFTDTLSRVFICDSLELTSNPKWISFVASSDSIVFEIFPRNCLGVNENGIIYNGMQAAIWNSCGGNSDSILVCQTICNDQPFTIGGNFFESGRKYNILLNGCHGDICNFIIKVIAGKQNFELVEPGPIIGASSFCPDSLDHLFSINMIPGSNSYQWYINDTLFSNTTLPVINIKNFIPGNYQLKVRAVNTCDTTNVSFKEFRVSPELKILNVLHTKVNVDSAYQITFKIEGGVKPYTVIKGSGFLDTFQSVFYSKILLCRSGFEFEIADAEGCTKVYKGFENCNCNSQAGTMPIDTIKVCEGQSFTAKFNGTEILDPGDKGVYILYTDPINPKSSILKISDNGLFPFDPGKFKFNINYYVSRVVGRADIRGEIKLSHPCISFSNFQPVIFRSRPIVSAGPDLTICGLEGNLSSLGNYIIGIWKLVSGPAQAIIQNPIADLTKVNVSVFGTYVFVREVSNSFCLHKDEVKVTFIESLKPIVDGFYFVCDGQSTALDGGNYAKFLWSTGDTTRYLNVSTSGTYCITVTDASNCSGSTCVAVSNSTAPVPSLLAPDTLCTGDIGFIQLTKSFLKYNWNTLDSNSILTIDTGGQYCVTVTGSNGCLGTECIYVNPKPRSFSFRFDTVCYGDNFSLLGKTFSTPGIHDIPIDNASRNKCDSVVRVNLKWHPQIILADTNIIHDDGSGSGVINIIISGGKPPYRYQWNTGAKTSIIINLVAGSYTVVVSDANNCNAIFIVTIKRLTATNEVQKVKGRFLIYPNPMNLNGTCIIENKSMAKDLKLFIYNYNGILHYKQNWNSKGLNDLLPLRLEIKPGIYIVKITDASGHCDIQKIIILD